MVFWRIFYFEVHSFIKKVKPSLFGIRKKVSFEGKSLGEQRKID